MAPADGPKPKPTTNGPALAELQRLFFDLVTAPEGVARELAKRGLPPEGADAVVDEMILGDARASAVERLDVYANMYFFRILDVLRGDYPKLLAVVGDDAFHNLATDYLHAHPSRHPSLRFVGAAMPGFVAGHALGAQRPWLGELAALEWARVDVFDRADVPLLTREAVTAVPADGFGAIALTPIPATEVVPAAFSIEETWRAVEDERAPQVPARAAEGHALLVWRRGVIVHHRPVAARERSALALLRAGTTFGALSAALREDAASDEEAAAQAVELLGRWLADELLAAG